LIIDAIASFIHLLGWYSMFRSGNSGGFDSDTGESGSLRSGNNSLWPRFSLNSEGGDEAEVEAPLLEVVVAALGGTRK
jgi:hypothetical protein